MSGVLTVFLMGLVLVISSSSRASSLSSKPRSIIERSKISSNPLVETTF